MTGSSPHEDVSDEELSLAYLEKRFPEVAGLVCGELIARCWHGEICNLLRQCILDLQTVTDAPED